MKSIRGDLVLLLIGGIAEHNYLGLALNACLMLACTWYSIALTLSLSCPTIAALGTFTALAPCSGCSSRHLRVCNSTQAECLHKKSADESAGGKEAASTQSTKIDSQPQIHANMAVNGSSSGLDSDTIARAAAANVVAMSRNMNNYQATLDSPMQATSSLARSSCASTEKGSLRIRKGSSYHGSSTMNGRRAISTFRSNSHFESRDIVKEHYHSVRDRCQRELGVGVGLHVLDTSHADLRHWIIDERLIRLPHKGSSWDRVLISAQYFADQVERLGQEIESFAPDSGAASNLVFGQCLLLLEKVYMPIQLSPDDHVANTDTAGL